MADERRRRPRRRAQTYQHHTNAVSITVYDPMGQDIPDNVRDLLERSVLAAALEHQLLISIAYT